MGYVGFSIIYSISVAAISEQSNRFIKILKPWVFMSWILTCPVLVLEAGGHTMNWDGADFGFGILWKMLHFTMVISFSLVTYHSDC